MERRVSDRKRGVRVFHNKRHVPSAAHKVVDGAVNGVIEVVDANADGVNMADSKIWVKDFILYEGRGDNPK